MHNFSITSTILLFLILLVAAILLVQTTRRRKKSNRSHHADWLARWNTTRTQRIFKHNSNDLKEHIKKLTDEANALLNRNKGDDFDKPDSKSQ